MPVKTKSGDGKCWAQWGQEGAKYYYECGNEEARKRAEAKAAEQGRAIESSKYRVEAYANLIKFLKQ